METPHQQFKGLVENKNEKKEKKKKGYRLIFNFFFYFYYCCCYFFYTILTLFSISSHLQGIRNEWHQQWDLFATRRIVDLYQLSVSYGFFYYYFRFVFITQSFTLAVVADVEDIRASAAGEVTAGSCRGSTSPGKNNGIQIQTASSRLN